jgi:O-antigen ligase
MIQGSLGRTRSALILSVLTAVLGYSVFTDGGVPSRSWIMQSACIGLLGIAAFSPLLSAKGNVCELVGLPRALSLTLILLPAYLLVQIIPLPVSFLTLLSPARAELLKSLDPVAPASGFAALSVAPYATVAALLQMIAYIIIFLLVREALLGLMEYPWAVAAPIIALGILEALIGLVQNAADPTATFIRGTYVNRNHFAGLLEMCLPFAAVSSWALYRRLRSGTATPFKTGVVLCLVGAGGAAMMFAILRSLSRSGFLAAEVSLLIVVVLLARARSHTLSFSAGLGLITLFLLAGLSSSRLLNRYAELFSEHWQSDIRLQLWKATLHLISSFPVFGCGAGNFESTFHRYNPYGNFTVDFAHCDYLQALAELGVTGFSIVMVFVYAIVRTALRATSARSPVALRDLNVGCVAAFAAILFHSFTDFNLHTPANAMLLAWIAGMAAVQFGPGQAQILENRSA